jgi:hypothetical protein
VARGTWRVGEAFGVRGSWCGVRSSKSNWELVACGTGNALLPSRKGVGWASHYPFLLLQYPFSSTEANRHVVAGKAACGS